MLDAFFCLVGIYASVFLILMIQFSLHKKQIKKTFIEALEEYLNSNSSKNSKE